MEMDELVLDELELDELDVAGLELDDDEFCELVLDELEFLLLVLDELELEELDELEKLDELEELPVEDDELLEDLVDEDETDRVVGELSDDTVDLDIGELSELTLDTLLTELVVPARVWLDVVVMLLEVGDETLVMDSSVEDDSDVLDVDDPDETEDTEETEDDSDDSDDRDDSEDIDDKLLLRAWVLDELELEDELFKDSSMSANTRAESPALKMNGPSTNMSLSVDALPCARGIATPSIMQDMSYCLGIVPRLKWMPMEWTMMGESGSRTISAGLLPPVPPSRSCSMISLLMALKAEVGTTVAWLTMAEVTGNPVETLTSPVPFNSSVVWLVTG